MFPAFLVDDAGKIEHDGSSGMTMDAESEIDPCKVDGTCPEVIKVYIFKADPGEDDLGKSDSIKLFNLIPFQGFRLRIFEFLMKVTFIYFWPCPQQVPKQNQTTAAAALTTPDL